MLNLTCKHLQLYINSYTENYNDIYQVAFLEHKIDVANNNYVYLWHLLLICQVLIMKKTSLKEKYPFELCDSLSF